MGTKEQIEDFLSKFSEYKPSIVLYSSEKDVIESIKVNLEGLEIKIFYGGLCPDCRLELSRLISVINALEVEDLGIEFIEVKRNMDDGLGRAYEMNILVVPTFIFFRNGKEIGRIIERPNDKMERDFAEIVGY